MEWLGSFRKVKMQRCKVELEAMTCSIAQGKIQVLTHPTLVSIFKSCLNLATGCKLPKLQQGVKSALLVKVRPPSMHRHHGYNEANITVTTHKR